jgi:hypothetical protein
LNDDTDDDGSEANEANFPDSVGKVADSSWWYLPPALTQGTGRKLAAAGQAASSITDIKVASKIDRVGPFDKRPSTEKLHNFIWRKK